MYLYLYVVIYNIYIYYIIYQLYYISYIYICSQKDRQYALPVISNPPIVLR